MLGGEPGEDAVPGRGLDSEWIYNNPSRGQLHLRDLFAGFAMVGIMAGQEADETNPRWVAAHAYDLADAMLHQRSEK